MESTWQNLFQKKERKEERNYLRDWNLAVETSFSAAREGEEAKLKEGGKKNEYKKIERKKESQEQGLGTWQLLKFVWLKPTVKCFSKKLLFPPTFPQEMLLKIKN